MSTKYKIHPGIGIARLGNSPTEFCISPEEPAALPIDCDPDGTPRLSPDGKSVLRVKNFKDSQGRIKRQAARFQIYVYSEECPDGRPLELGDTIKGGGNEGVLVDIQWRVYLANKKAVWYKFKQQEGEHGYSPDHPRRNADITDSNARQQLIIDPGPRIISSKNRDRAQFSRDGHDLYSPTFPPPLKPNSIDTLGEMMTGGDGRLLVLGGFGSSGSYKFNEFGQPRIDSYANNDGWFDDTADGPVMARLVMYSSEVEQYRFIDVDYPAWVIVGYPAYVPEILDLVTLEDVLYDLAIRNFAYRTDLYGEPGTFNNPPQINPSDTKALLHWKAGTLEWNPKYKPWFYRDIWPILFRPDEYTWLSNVLSQSNYPHDQTGRGNFNLERLALPPVLNKRALEECRKECMVKNHSGELFSQSLDPILTILDSDANGTLLQNLSQFDETIQTLIAAYESQGNEFSDEKKTRYRALLDHLRQNYPTFLGDILFIKFKSQIQKETGKFSEKVHSDKGETLDHYLADWKSTFAKKSDKYEQGKKTLQNDIRQIVNELCAESIAVWINDVAEIMGLFNDLGQLFSQVIKDLHNQIEDYLSHYLFERLINYTLRELKLYRSGKLLKNCENACIEKCTIDPFRNYRQYLYDLLRLPGEENHFHLGGKPNKRTTNLPLMPLLCGDNPISNTLPSKFFRLTDYQLFLIRQWAMGLFYNEEMEGWNKPTPYTPYAGWSNKTGEDLDRGVLFNLLGGSFCPGGEVTWIIRNPAVYYEPFRIKADPDFYTFRQTAAQANQQRGGVTDPDYVSYVDNPLSQDSDFDRGLQPGDLTKYMALPWQSDFNECSTQDINITYEEWNEMFPDSEGDSLLKRESQVWETMWWPAHRPLQTYEVTAFTEGKPTYQILNWSRGIPGTNAGNLKMVTAWAKLGFVIRNPYESSSKLDQASPIDASVNKFISNRE